MWGKCCICSDLILQNSPSSNVSPNPQGLLYLSVNSPINTRLLESSTKQSPVRLESPLKLGASDRCSLSSSLLSVQSSQRSGCRCTSCKSQVEEAQSVDCVGFFSLMHADGSLQTLLSPHGLGYGAGLGLKLSAHWAPFHHTASDDFRRQVDFQCLTS